MTLARTRTIAAVALAAIADTFPFACVPTTLNPDPRHEIARLQPARLDPSSRRKSGEIAWYRRVHGLFDPRNLVCWCPGQFGVSVLVLTWRQQDRLDGHFLACLLQHAPHKSIRLTAPAGAGTIYRGV